MAGMIKVEAIWAQCLSRNPSPVTFPQILEEGLFPSFLYWKNPAVNKGGIFVQCEFG